MLQHTSHSMQSAFPFGTPPSDLAHARCVWYCTSYDARGRAMSARVRLREARAPVKKKSLTGVAMGPIAPWSDGMSNGQTVGDEPTTRYL
jgi:hypothetical protein